MSNITFWFSNQKLLFKGGLLSSIGQNSGEYRGAKETNEKCKAAVDETFKQAKNESEEEKTE